MLASISAKRRQFLLLGLLLIAAALPLGYFHQSLWRDEASSVWFARLPAATLLTALCDPHPPGYYLLLKGWLTGGQSEFWLRLPSLFGAVLAVALTYRLGRDLGRPEYAWLAALLLVFHPLQSWYAAELRMYPLVQALGLLLVWSGWRLLKAPDQAPFWRLETAGYGLVSLLALGLDYTALLPFVLIQFLWMVRGASRPWSWLALQATILGLAALLWADASHLEAMQRDYRLPLLAVYFSRVGLNFEPVHIFLLLGLFASGAIGAGFLISWIWAKRSNQRLDSFPLAAALALGWLIVLGLAAAPRLFTVKRHLLVILPYLALAMSMALRRFPWPTGYMLAGVGLLLTLTSLAGHQREPWREVIAQLSRSAPARSVVWVDELVVPVFDYYASPSDPQAEALTWRPLFDQPEAQPTDLALWGGDTVWIVTTDAPYRRLTTLLPSDFYHAHYLSESRHWPGIDLYRYRRRSNPVVDLISPFSLPPGLTRENTYVTSPLDTCRPE